MSKIRIGVVGLGMGAGHIDGFRKHPEAEVVAVADTDPVRLEQRGKKDFKIPNCYLSVEEMLKKEKLDIVSIATPNKFHKPLTIAALKAGCHVLCEKPMAMNAQEAEEMNDAAKKAKKRIMINFSFRFTEQSYAIKKEVDSGILGKIYFGRTIWHGAADFPALAGGSAQRLFQAVAPSLISGFTEWILLSG